MIESQRTLLNVEFYSVFFFTEPSFTVTLEAALNPQATAEPTELACHVTNITHLPLGGRLGVTWEHTTLPGTCNLQNKISKGRSPTRNHLLSLSPVQSPAGIGNDPQTSNPIGSLDGHGNLLPGAMYSDRLKTGVITLTRVQPHTFKLRFLRTQVKQNDPTAFDARGIISPKIYFLLINKCKPVTKRH